MGLSPLQVRVARCFFALPESAGFALAGGSALLAQHLVERTTKDLDLFGTERRTIHVAADALQEALLKEGLVCAEVRRHPTFVRLEVSDGEDTSEIDLAYDSQWRDSVSNGASWPPVRLDVVELVIARNPDEESRLGFLLLVPLGDGIVFRTSGTWPRTNALYCHPVDRSEWPEEPEIVECAAVRSAGSSPPPPERSAARRCGR